MFAKKQILINDFLCILLTPWVGTTIKSADKPVIVKESVEGLTKVSYYFSLSL